MDTAAERSSLEHVKVADIMSQPVITVTPEATVKEAARLLVAHGISALPVLDGKGRLVGIVSEADLIPIETRPDSRSQATPLRPTAGSMPRTVSEVMTRHVHTVPMDAEVSQAARMLLEEGLKRVPVVSGHQVVGIVSRRDLVKVIARRDEDLENEISRRLSEAGIMTPHHPVDMTWGVATIDVGEQETARRLAESIALTVPGVIEVRFRTRD